MVGVVVDVRLPLLLPVLLRAGPRLHRALACSLVISLFLSCFDETLNEFSAFQALPMTAGPLRSQFSGLCCVASPPLSHSPLFCSTPAGFIIQVIRSDWKIAINRNYKYEPFTKTLTIVDFPERPIMFLSLCYLLLSLGYLLR